MTKFDLAKKLYESYYDAQLKNFVSWHLLSSDEKEIWERVAEVAMDELVPKTPGRFPNE